MLLRRVLCFNRTFMELKWLRSEHVTMRKVVLIVPLWNWNVFGWGEEVWIRKVLIVPLWNWNYFIHLIDDSLLFVLIVPLWNWNSGLLVVPSWSASRFNRTFMELKCTNNISTCVCCIVLIVPLWNWNISFYFSSLC